jgi:hypothetical protein
MKKMIFMGLAFLVIGSSQDVGIIKIEENPTNQTDSTGQTDPTTTTTPTN